MLRTILVASVALCLACGSDEPQRPAPKPTKQAQSSDSRNAAPVIAAVEISPSEPTVSDTLTVAVQVQDPDRDPVEVEIEWYRNGQLFLKGDVSSIEPFQFAREDRIHVVAHATDGDLRVSGHSDEVEIFNTAPRITSLKLTPEQPLSDDMLEVQVESKDVDQDRIVYKYRWLVGTQELPGELGSRLVPGSIKRGQRVVVQVLAEDGIDDSGWVTSNPIAVNNAPPKIVTQPNYQLAGPTEYSYQMQAQDPDGDAPLKFDLVKGPPGMQVNATSGLVSWRIQPGVSGKFPIELAVSDPFGAQVLQRYALEVDWQTDSEEQGDDDRAQPANAAPREDLDRDGDDAEEVQLNEDVDRSLIDTELGDDSDDSSDDDYEDDDQDDDEEDAEE